MTSYLSKVSALSDLTLKYEMQKSEQKGKSSPNGWIIDTAGLISPEELSNSYKHTVQLKTWIT